jgi:hypothetical protein
VSSVPIMVSGGRRVCGGKRAREDKSGRAERDSRNSKSAKSHGNSLSCWGGRSSAAETPPSRQSVTPHHTMKLPTQVGNGENYPSFDSPDRGVASLILGVGHLSPVGKHQCRRETGPAGIKAAIGAKTKYPQANRCDPPEAHEFTNPVKSAEFRCFSAWSVQR